MSRQFDEYTMDKFDLFGEMYSLVEPKNFKELIDALRIKDIIQDGLSSKMHDEDSNGLYDLLYQQENYINEYLNSLGDFNNVHLVKNIAFLTKKHHIALGDLEKMLGISAGYISRTAKENSNKKMSIDVVWKLSKIFDVDLRKLIETDLNSSNKNTEILAKFIEKLQKQTDNYSIEWNSCGGVLCVLEDRFVDMGIITEEGDVSIYHPRHLNPNLRWILTNDIMSFKMKDINKELVIIPFKSDKTNVQYYDFIFVWSNAHELDETDIQHHWEKVFYSSDDPFGYLNEQSNILYDKIQCQEFDAKLTPNIKQIIIDYLE